MNQTMATSYTVVCFLELYISEGCLRQHTWISLYIRYYHAMSVELNIPKQSCTSAGSCVYSCDFWGCTNAAVLTTWNWPWKLRFCHYSAWLLDILRMGCTAEINEMVPSSETMSLYRVVSTVKLIYLYYAHQDAASTFEANAFLIMLLRFHSSSFA